jgi:hypothetical protein
MVKRTRIWAIAALVGALALLATAPTVLAGGAVKTGTYSGKTSQKVKVGFELSTSKLECPHLKKGGFCLSQLDSQSANLTDTCPGGASDGVQELIDPKPIGKNHRLHEAFGQTDVAGRLTVDAKVTAGHISGWFEDRFSTGGGPVCSSGKVTFTTKRTGKVK